MLVEELHLPGNGEDSILEHRVCGGGARAAPVALPALVVREGARLGEARELLDDVILRHRPILGSVPHYLLGYLRHRRAGQLRNRRVVRVELVATVRVQYRLLVQDPVQHACHEPVAEVQHAHDSLDFDEAAVLGCLGGHALDIRLQGRDVLAPRALRPGTLLPGAPRRVHELLQRMEEKPDVSREPGQEEAVLVVDDFALLLPLALLLGVFHVLLQLALGRLMAPVAAAHRAGRIQPRRRAAGRQAG
mmetsp:Transcript_102769/g.291004  ORF Transcript_102769/g.291004 Transcript_102769/m.291004 type:complete len:248 (+) Transcript_102769:915-1658(+)